MPEARQAQIIKYKWDDGKPYLFIRHGNEITKKSLIGNDINLIIGKKACLGYFRGGKNFVCRNSRITEDMQCNECKLEDDYFFCIKCDGSECLNDKKREECRKNYYYIYLAAFDSLLKVGISFEHRIQERLVEQGADLGALVARLQDGKAARIMEQGIKRELNIADRLAGEKKAALLFANPNNSINEIMKAVAVLRKNGFSRYLYGPEIFDFRSFYSLEKVRKTPIYTEIEDGLILNGRVVSAKGGIVIFEKDDDFFSVNAHRLLGRHISFN